MDDTRDTSYTGGITPEVEGMLVRVLDGELSGSAEREAQAILDSSLEARLRLEELWIEADLFSEQLAELPVPRTPEPTFLFRGGVRATVPEAESPDALQEPADREYRGPDAPGRRSFTLPSGRFRYRVAAAIVLALLSLSLITPVRAWIVDSACNLLSALLPEEEPSAPPVESAAGSSVVRFVPVGSELMVTVREHQSSGRLTVVAVDGSWASGEISGEDPGVEILVLPSGIEVRNEAGSVAGYRVEVPRTMERLRVRVGGRELATYSLEGVTAGHVWVFELVDPTGP